MNQSPKVDRIASALESLEACQSSPYTGYPSLLMTPGSGPSQHALAHQIELGSTVTDTLDNLESVHWALQLTDALG
jgi:hypothetical protein